jgi:hypothetical protein
MFEFAMRCISFFIYFLTLRKLWLFGSLDVDTDGKQAHLSLVYIDLANCTILLAAP